MTKILVIEDTPDILNNILDFLEAEDFEAIGAENGREGVEQAQSQEFDLIICDIMMPELDGYEVLSELRQDPKTATIPFIFLTAKGDRSDIRQGMNLGADDYLTKPFTKGELLEAISARMKRSQQQTEQLKQVSQQLDRLEKFDNLTGLPNLSALEGREGYLDRAMERVTELERQVPFLLLGLDKFARINDTIGYRNGDLILQQVALRLEQFVSEFETGAVVRMGGDEFGIVLSPVETKETAVAIAQELLQTIAQPYQNERRSVPLTGAIGIAFYPTAPNLEELRRQAGVALGEAKAEGGNCCKLYTRPIFGFDAAKDLQLAADLRRAWDQKQLQLSYQPRVDLRKKKIVGVGVVPSWQHPRMGEISPEKITALAEEAGLLRDISEWILRRGCQQAKIWQQESRLYLRVAVTLSEQLFNEANVGSIVVDALRSASLEPGYLELEIPADAIAKTKNVNAMALKLREFKQLGIQLTISNFGMGQTYIDYLGELAMDNLKIDRGLARNVNQNAPIVNAIAQMAHGIKLRVVVDGIDTDAQINVLKKQKCDEIQQAIAVSEGEIKRAFGKR